MKTTAGTVCVREVVISTRGESVLDAAKLMREHHVGCLVVVENRGGQNHPIGVITDRDIVVEALATSHDRLEELVIGDLLTRPLVTVHTEDNVDDALATLRIQGVRRAPVVDDAGALIGIIAVDDLIELLGDRLSELAVLFARERHIEQEQRV